jgi:polysaccharide biosynthesis transport protein
LYTEAPGFDNILDFARRRKLTIFLTFLAVFSVAAIVAFTLPAVYKSTATILIEGQQIPSEFVQTTVTTLVEETIQTITQRVMSRRKLTEIIERFDLYDDLKNRKTTEEILEKMRKDIALDTISSEVANPRSGRATVATIAFSLSYQGKDPAKVQKVTNTLASLYLEENLKTREARAKTTTEFMESELDALQENISGLEARIAGFKKENMDALPEMAAVNMKMVETLQQEISAKEQQIQTLQDRKVYLEGQLATLDPHVPGAAQTLRDESPTQRLRRLRSVYTMLTASLSDKHPDVVRTRREISSLEKELGVEGNNVGEMQSELATLQTDLASMEETLSPSHPDIVATKRAIENLQQEIKKQEKNGDGADSLTEDVQNPAYINIATQVETTKMDIQALRREQDALEKRLQDYQARLERAAKVESEYQELTRDYSNARTRYQEILSKLMMAKTAEGLEKDQMGQRFTIIDSAVLPEKPHKPNRLAIVLVGFLLGIGSGAGLGAVKEVSDRAVRSEAALFDLTGAPVLAVIPMIVTNEDVKKKRRKRLVFGFSAATVSALCIGAVHMFYRPLDVLWFQVLRKLVSLGIVSP